MVLVLLLVNYIITLHWFVVQLVFNSPEAKVVIINLCLIIIISRLPRTHSSPEDVRESVLGTAGSADVGPGH